MFEKKKIKKSNSFNKKRTFKWKNITKSNKKNNKLVLKWIGFLLISFLLISIIGGAVLYKKYIEPLPPVESIKNMSIAQTSIIYDKDWWELYKIFKENRTYVDYKNISQNMVNALVAWEDQRFWTTPGFDLIWIARATLNWIFTWDFRGTSWLSQQLMKVTYLTSERSLERKVKEFYLSWKLNKVFDKEKIVELYLNKIFFWSNAYWVEQASKTFFGINSSELDILQSSILASLPKAPSWLSPYNHNDRLMGYPLIYVWWDIENKSVLLTKNDIEDNKLFLSKLVKFIDNLQLKRIKNNALICGVNKEYIKPWTFRVDGDWCVTLWFDELLNFLNAIIIVDWEYTLEYQTWRKDYILWRMLEDNYIDFDVYKKALLDSFGFEFQKYKSNIKYPYFVMYIKEYLENKYWKEIVEQGWFRIFTTLDSKLQDEAESLIEKYWEINETKFWAKNSALIAIDNENGWILSMVGWRDYFDLENGWNNNMTTSRLQPGSTFKPFAYALAIANNPIWSKSPVYDLKTSFPGGYIPNNFDWEFVWKMNISTALNNSRNIPAIKMFYMAGWEENIISFMEKLWVKTLRNFKEEYKKNHNWKEYSYSAPMALWTGLMTPLELAWAYATFANMWVNKWINPIIRIEDRKWNIIENRDAEKIKKSSEESISPALAYIMNSILSDTETRPAFWNTYLSLGNRKIAAKTGTSTKQYTENWNKVIAPRNLWTIWYTPQITTVVWVWNTSGKELYLNWNWLEWAGPIMRDYMKFAHKDLPVKGWSRPLWVKTLNVSNVSWLLPSKDFPEEFLVSSNFLNAPTEYDNSLKYIEVDSLCNWKVTKNTPDSAIRKWYLLNFHSLNPAQINWESAVQAWVETWEWKEKYPNVESIITDYTDEVCPRAWIVSTIIKTDINNDDVLFIWKNNIDLAYKSERWIIKIEVYLWDVLLTTVAVWNKTKKWLTLSVPIPAHFSNSTWILKFRVIDNEYYSYDENVDIKILSTDNVKPVIDSNLWDVLKIKNGESFNITWTVNDQSPISEIKYYLNSILVKEDLNTDKINYLVLSDWLENWENIFEIIAKDSSMNEVTKEIKIILE